MPGHDRGPLAPLPPPVQRDHVGRSGAARAARAAHRPRGRPRRKDADAGFTTERDLGTEGAGYADVGLKQAIDQGIVPGPRLLVATRAIVARGAYGPKGFEPGVAIPQGAEEVAGVDETIRAVARPDRRRRRRRQVLRRLSLGPGRAEPAHPVPGRADAGVAAAHDAGGSSPSTRPPPKACGARCSPAPTRSSTATAAPPKCSRRWRPKESRCARRSARPKPTRATSSTGTARSPRPRACRRTAARSSWR